MKGMYCTPCESFLTESQLVDGKCPDCGREVTAGEGRGIFLPYEQICRPPDRVYQ